MLFDKLMRGNQLSNRFRFVSSSRVSGATISREPDSVREHLVERFRTTASTESLYLLPYNTGLDFHSKLLLIFVFFTLKFASKLLL